MNRTQKITQLAAAASQGLISEDELFDELERLEQALTERIIINGRGQPRLSKVSVLPEGDICLRVDDERNDEFWLELWIRPEPNKD